MSETNPVPNPVPTDGPVQVILIDARLSGDDRLALKALNPRAAFVEVLEARRGDAPAAIAAIPAKTAIVAAEHAEEPTDATPEQASLWLDIAAGLLSVGATILVPAAWAPFVSGALKIGIPEVRRRLAGQPVTERWPIERLLALKSRVDALPDPT